MMRSKSSARGIEGEATSQRPVLRGMQHMAVAGHYGAAHAAFAILEAGGNAVDAGVAAGIALGVLQCDIVNIAGVAPIMIFDARSGEVHTIAGLGHWPRRTDLGYFTRHCDGTIPDGLLRTVVPAAPEAWITALQRFGTMSFGDVAAAAIRFAADGFVVYPLLAHSIKTHQAEYKRWPSNAAIYLPGGRPPVVGDIFRQAELAATLQFMVDEEKTAARHGRAAGLAAARDAFYAGDIAATITRFHRENGGWLREDDLSAFRLDVEPATMASFGGTQVYSCGAWCQGPVLLQTLSLLDPHELNAMGHNSVDYIHTIIEALKLAFADRDRYYGDPRFVEVPLARLISPSYAAERRKLIRADRAWPEMPPAGDGTAVDVARAQSSPAEAKGPRDTSYVCVVDRHGNAFSATPSDVSFDTIVIPGTGLCPSSRGSQSWTDPGHPSCLAPGKRPRLTPSPALAIRPGEWVMPFGSPGADVQLQAMLQVFLNTSVFGMDLQEAVEAPRFATYSFPESSEPHTYLPGRVNIEDRFDGAVETALSNRGHDLAIWPQQTWRAGAVCAIRAELETGVLTGGADPRRPGYAVGW